MSHDTPTADATASVIALPELHPLPPEPPELPLLHDVAHPLHAIRARLQVCVGTAEITVGELLAARENQVMALDRRVDAAVDLLVEGKVVARGQLVAVDDHFAVRITELPLALKA